MRTKTFSAVNVCMFLIALLLFAQPSEKGSLFAAGYNGQADENSLFVYGRITRVENDGTVVIQPSQGAGIVPYVDEETKIFRDDRRAEITDLRLGDEAQVEYTPSSFAILIQIVG